MEEYTKEFFWNTYKALPEELKEAIFDENNNRIVYNICNQLGLNEDRTSIVSKYTGRVLMGLLSLKDFNVTLELELNIDETLANKIYREIDASIFKNLRLALSRLEEEKFGNEPERPRPFLEETSPPAEPEKENQPTKLKVPPLENVPEILEEEGIIDDIQFPKVKSLFKTLTATLTKKFAQKPALAQSDVLIDLSDQAQSIASAPTKSAKPQTLTLEPLSDVAEKSEPVLQTEKPAKIQPQIQPLEETPVIPETPAVQETIPEPKPVATLESIPISKSEPALNPEPAPMPTLEPILEKPSTQPKETTPPPQRIIQADPYREAPI